MVSRAEQNLDRWIKTHSLPSSFPLLLADAKPDEPYLRDYGEEIKRIANHLQGSFRSLIVFPAGQGTSTLLNEIVRRKRKSEEVFQLFVVVDVRKAFADDAKRSLNELIAEDLLSQLASDNWVRRLTGQFRQSLVSIFDFETDLDLVDLQNQRRNPSHWQAEIARVTQAWSNRLGELYRTLQNEVGLSVVLCFDFPHDATEDVIFEIVRDVKWFDENEKGPDFPQTALREAYFVTERQAELIQGIWSVDFQRFTFPAYAQAEVFQILSHHFRPEASHSKGRIALAQVMSDEYLAEVWRENTPLVALSEALKSAILADFDFPPNQLPYNLRPRG
jgi:hypothetical protein